MTLPALSSVASTAASAREASIECTIFGEFAEVLAPLLERLVVERPLDGPFSV